MKLEITGDDLHSLMDSLPTESQDIFKKVLMAAMSKSPMAKIEHWLEQYEANDPIDMLVCQLISQVIIKVSGAIMADLKRAKKQEKPQYNGKDAAIVAVREIRKIADQLEEHINHECESCADKEH